MHARVFAREKDGDTSRAVTFARLNCSRRVFRACVFNYNGPRRFCKTKCVASNVKPFATEGRGFRWPLNWEVGPRKSSVTTRRTTRTLALRTHVHRAASISVRVPTLYRRRPIALFQKLDRFAARLIACNKKNSNVATRSRVKSFPFSIC